MTPSAKPLNWVLLSNVLVRQDDSGTVWVEVYMSGGNPTVTELADEVKLSLNRVSALV